MSDAAGGDSLLSQVVLPRDLKPGDKIDRVDSNLDFVVATVKEVKKIRRLDRTVYKVYLNEADEVPEGQRGWAEHRHLSPFILSPRSQISVKREVDSRG